jgi:hypothetical protein
VSAPQRKKLQSDRVDFTGTIISASVRRVKRAIVFLLFASTATAAPEHIGLRFDGDFDCPSAIAIRAAIDKQFGVGVFNDEKMAVTLRVSALPPSKLVLTLSDSADEKLVRELTTDTADCDAIADTAALVIEAWLRELPWKGAMLATVTTQPQSPPAEAKPLPLSKNPSVTQSGIARRFAQPATRKLHLAVWASGGGAVALESRPPAVGAGRVAVELGLGRYVSLGVNAGVLSAYRLTFSLGHVDVVRVPLALFARLEFLRAGKTGFSLLGGIELDVSKPTASGAVSASATLLDPGIWLAADWRWAFSRHLFLAITPSCTVLLRTDNIQIGNLGTLATTARAWFDVQAGLGWRFF